MLEYLLFIILFFVGLGGLFMSRRNLFLLLMAMDITFLSIALLFLHFSVLYDDLTGTIFFFLILVISALEAVLGLSLIVASSISIFSAY
jgi:NADH:ubiquinone oxidoreductase subunit K